MANARLLRQSIEDYQKDVNGQVAQANDAYTADYAAYKAGMNAYNSQVSDYTSKVDAIKAGGTGWLPIGDGTYNLFKGVNGNLIPAYSENVTPLSALPENYSPGPNTILVNEGGVGQNYWRSSTGQKWNKTAAAPIISSVSATAPNAPIEAKVELPKEPNITVSDTRELMNPGQNQAQLSMNTAKGILGKSELAGDQQVAMRGSAFADPNDPQGLKERGVLARVMGGQL